MRFRFLAMAACTIALLTGCMANSVTPQGQKSSLFKVCLPNINALTKEKSLATQGNWLTGSWTSNSNLALGARNDLRNEAAELGANVVVITETINATDEDNSLENITHVGRAYLCR